MILEFLCPALLCISSFLEDNLKKIGTPCSSLASCYVCMLGGNSTSKELVELRNKQEPSLPGAKALKKTVSTTTVSMGPVSVPRKGVEAPIPHHCSQVILVPSLTS